MPVTDLQRLVETLKAIGLEQGDSELSFRVHTYKHTDRKILEVGATAFVFDGNEKLISVED